LLNLDLNKNDKGKIYFCNTEIKVSIGLSLYLMRSHCWLLWKWHQACWLYIVKLLLQQEGM